MGHGEVLIDTCVIIDDASIAATAHRHQLRLATRTVRHFPMLQDLLLPYS